jgi:histidine phosphotransfer protein HptB
VSEIYTWTRASCEFALRDVMEGGFADLLDTFLADSDERLRAIASMARGPTELMAVAHSFKGSSSNMGAIRLALLVRRTRSRGAKKQRWTASKRWCIENQ